MSSSLFAFIDCVLDKIDLDIISPQVLVNRISKTTPAKKWKIEQKLQHINNTCSMRRWKQRGESVGIMGFRANINMIVTWLRYKGWHCPGRYIVFIKISKWNQVCMLLDNLSKNKISSIKLWLYKVNDKRGLLILVDLTNLHLLGK